MGKKTAFRKISVLGKQYKWKYCYDNLEFTKYPFSYYLFVPDENKKLMVKVIFRELEPPMLIEKDCGTRAKYGDKEIWINLNRPRYVALVIGEVFKGMVDIKNDFGTKELNGESILRSLGYEFQNFSDRIGRKS